MTLLTAYIKQFSSNQYLKILLTCDTKNGIEGISHKLIYPRLVLGYNVLQPNEPLAALASTRSSRSAVPRHGTTGEVAAPTKRAYFGKTGSR